MRHYILLSEFGALNSQRAVNTGEAAKVRSSLLVQRRKISWTSQSRLLCDFFLSNYFAHVDLSVTLPAKSHLNACLELRPLLINKNFKSVFFSAADFQSPSPAGLNLVSSPLQKCIIRMLLIIALIINS